MAVLVLHTLYALSRYIAEELACLTLEATQLLAGKRTIWLLLGGKRYAGQPVCHVVHCSAVAR